MSLLLSLPPQNLDSWNQIVMRDSDGGDSAARDGGYAFLELLINGRSDCEAFELRLSQLRVGWGLYRRHPDPSKWYSLPENFSRDQLYPLQIGLSSCGLWQELLRSIGRRALRLGFYQNSYPDWVKPGDEGYKWKVPDWSLFGPDEMRMLSLALFVRYHQTRQTRYAILASALDILTMPVSLIGDFSKLVNALSIIYKAKQDVLFSDDSNFVMSLLLSERTDTLSPFGKLAEYLYFKYRPVVNDSTTSEGRGEHLSGPDSAMLDYFNPRNGSPPLAQAFIEAMKRWIGK